MKNQFKVLTALFEPTLSSSKANQEIFGNAYLARLLDACMVTVCLQGREELADVLQSLLKKAAAAKGEASPSPSMSKKRGRKPSTGPRKRQKSLEVVSTENMFASTIIDYKVYEKPSAKRQSAVLPGKRSLGIAVMTPVRRSSRHSTHSTSPVASQKLLYKSNSALVDE